MNRPLIITIGIVIIGLVVSVWVYLLLFGTPQEPRDIFTNFGFITPNEEGLFEDVRSTEESSGISDLALEGQLEQLTMRPVAGHVFMLTEDAILVRYVEMGTGHIYEVNLTESQESQVSITTVPETARAVFSSNGESVALISYDQMKESVTIGSIDEESKELRGLSALPADVRNVAFRTDTTVYYTQKTDTQTIGKYYDVTNNTSTELFRIELQDVIMRWGSDTTTHFAITRSTPLLPGGMYKIQNGILSPVGHSGNGLVGFANSSAVVTSIIEDGMYVTYSESAEGNLRQPDVYIPEKCTFDVVSATEMWCGIPHAVVDASYIERWYTGEETSIDALWSVKLQDQTSRRVLNLADTANKDIDLMDLKADITGNYLSFINKIDQSLWLYKIGDF